MIFRIICLTIQFMALVACTQESAETDKRTSSPTPFTQDFYGTTEAFASEAVYFLLTDRFVDGDKNNNYPKQGGDNHSFDRPLVTEQGEANIGYLGGDFKGVLNNAAYIADMGFTSVWITPIVDNPDQAFTGGAALGEHFYADKGKTGYHGYWGVNFFKEDEHLISNGLNFSDLTLALKERHNLNLVLDIVANHGSPSFDMPVDQPKFGELYDANGVLVADHKNNEPKNLDHSDSLQQWFHQQEDIAQLSNLNEGNPALVDYLVESYLQWIDQGAAAFRIDTIRHLPHSFWKEVSDRVRDRHPGFFMFGEHFAYDAEKIAEHMLPENGSISVLDFPGQRAMTTVFENPDSDYRDMLSYLHLDDKTYVNPYQLMTFYDNHDMARMNADEAGFIDANNWLFTSRGIPVVYYGSETGFMAGTKEHYGNRNYYGQARINDALTHPIRQSLKKIAHVRKQSIALQRGVQINLEFTQHTAAFYRVYQKDNVYQTALVLLNKSKEPANFSVNQFVSVGEWQDAETGKRINVEQGGGKIEAHVAAHGVSVLLLNAPVNHPGLVASIEQQMAFRTDASQ